jgi:hypothetical protein
MRAMKENPTASGQSMIENTRELAIAAIPKKDGFYGMI